MARKSETVTLRDVDGEDHVYVFRQIPGPQGIDLFVGLLSRMGSNLGDLFELAKQMKQNESSSFLDADIDWTKLGGTIAATATSLAQYGTSKLVGQMLADTLRDGKAFSSSIAVDTATHWCMADAYTGNYLEMFSALGNVLRLNYANLFGGLLKDLDSVADKRQQASRPS